jgi:uncharacterized protein
MKDETFVTTSSRPRRTLVVLLAALGIGVVGVARAGPSAEAADAAMRGDSDQLLSLLEHGADVNAAQGDGMTALHWAVRNQDVEVARSLIYAGANVRAATRLNAVTPLWLAAQTGDAVMVYMLLDNKAEADAPNGDGVTPLMIAAASGNPDAVHILIERGANPNAAEKTYGQTPLMFAAASNEADVIPVLVEKGADVATATKVRTSPTTEPMGGLTALHYAVRQGNVEAVDALLDRGADINQVSADDTTPLMLATINGQFDLAMHLLERGADATIATSAGGTPLYRVIDLQWAPKSTYPQPAATRQQKTSYLDLIKALLDRGADPNARLRKALWYTRYGAGTEGIDPAGATPFWRAAQAGDVDAMRLLVSRGADPALKTADGVSPLMVVAGAGYRDTAATTVPAGRMPALRYLVEELHADVNETDAKAGDGKKTGPVGTRGYTPIHNAAARGDNEMISYLVSKGARVDLVGKNGVTPVDMASSAGERGEPFPETVKLLESLGAKISRRP